MRAVFVLCLISMAYGAYYEEMYHRLKNDVSKMRAEMTWKMGMNKRFRGMSEEQLRAMSGATFDGLEELPVKKSFRRNLDLPKSFDARDHWPNCKYIPFIRDQSNCGSCWAVSTASVMTDRHCIASSGRDQPYISDEYVLSCCGPECGRG
ncbi:unnamed protein product [Soboliphyme baturini]|uniref:Pept_C1 domain-containing protein n=1 Tax=Soboliphyme baturini TaxID=241478 RepID=A0A183IAJ8_9BILA|nr:unnamed protein product [Soboliphyme baturini]